MIFGWLGFPALGIKGAAYATLISQLVLIIMGIYILSRNSMMIRFRFSNLWFEWESVKKVFSIGFPASLTLVMSPLGMAALISVISSKFLEAGAISYSIGFRVEFFSFLPAMSYGFASMAMLGQNLGAGKISRAIKAYKTALLQGFLIAGGFGVIAAIFAKQIVMIFTTEPLVIEYTLSYLYTMPFSFGFFAIVMVITNSFQGIGKPWPGFIILLLKFAVIAVPGSLILTRYFDAPILSVWIMIAVSNIITALVGYIWLGKRLNSLSLEQVPVHK